MELTQVFTSGKSGHIPTSRPLPVKSEGSCRYDTTLNKFIVQCGTLSSGESATSGTFVDDAGVPRYSENWQQVKTNTVASFKYELSSTGCVDIPVKLACDGGSAQMPEKYSVSFLLDFQTLWKYFERDSVDEVAEYAPLFRVYIETCFHQRTVQVMVFLTLYYFAVSLSVDQYFLAVPLFRRVVYYFYILVQGFVYLSLVVLFKGSVFHHTRSFDKKDVSDEKGTATRVKRNIKRNQIGRWVYFAQEAFRTTTLEMQRMYEHDSTGPATPLNHVTPFYDALNVTAKFLSKNHMRCSDRIRLNQPLHNMKLFFIFFAVPVYCVIATYYSVTGPYPLYVAICKAAGSDSPVCDNFRWIFILTLGYVVAAMQTTIFMSSVLLALVGLGFGAEMGRALVDSWITRFGPLRRLEHDKPVEFASADNQNGEGPSKDKDPRLRVPPTPNTVVNELHRQLEKHMQLVQCSAEDVEADVFVTPQEVLPYLPRDAYEHYLFVREFMTTGSRAWSPTIIALTFLCAYFIALFVCGALLIGGELSALNWVYYACWIFVRVYLLTIYPVMSLAHANAYVYALQEQFLVAAPEDFAVLGGRDAWLDYLVKVPAVWTIYGFEVNWDRLSGLLWTFIAALGAWAISYISSVGF